MQNMFLFPRFACSDIQPVSRSEALVAVTSYRGARDLLSRSGAISSQQDEVFYLFDEVC